MSQWTIEGHEEIDCGGCFRKVWTRAQKLAMDTGQEVIVRYTGRRFPRAYAQARSDLRVLPSGEKDFTIDRDYPKKK